MDGFFSASFTEELPAHIQKALFSGSGTGFHGLIDALKARRFQALADQESLANTLDRLKQDSPELFEMLEPIISSSKVRPGTSKGTIASELEGITGIRKSVLKEISGVFNENTDHLFHSSFGDEKWANKIMDVCNKPVFENSLLRSKNSSVFFVEQSISLNLHQGFSWTDLFRKYHMIVPFKTIRIQDPYLYQYIEKSGLSTLLKQLLSRSKPESIRVEIISNLTPPNSRFRKIDIQTNVIDYLRDTASHCELILYDQKSDHSNRFHKRVIWTDWWVLQSDIGFNFLSKGPHGKKQVQRENNLFLTGKYASTSSLWNQINNQWESYLEVCDCWVVC